MNRLIGKTAIVAMMAIATCNAMGHNYPHQATNNPQTETNNPQQEADNARIVTTRADGRYASTLGQTRALMKAAEPRLAYKRGMTPEQHAQWRSDMSEAMRRIMHHPEMPSAQPVKVAERKGDGYRVEKWESYPLESAVVSFLVLIPDGVTAETPANGAVLCIPGFGGTKEALAGVKAGDYDLQDDLLSEVANGAMARIYADAGLVAVAVDNPSFGELSDNGKSDYLYTSRMLLELGWSYLGLSSFQDRVVLEWMKMRPEFPADKIIISGFSLGTEPMMVLGLMDPTIHAFVYNDFLCTTRERILVMTKPDANGSRPFPNSIEHLIPEFLVEFDFPDIVAALAPRPIIFLEGGMDRDFNKVADSYRVAGAEGAAEFHHYPKYADQASRQYLEQLPEGLDLSEFFHLVNCNPPAHGFKRDLALPWVVNVSEE